MSSNGSSSTGAWPPVRPSRRTKMRNGTFIIPSTGERSRRQFTLRGSSSLSPTDSDEDRAEELAETFREKLWVVALRIRAWFLAVWIWLNSESGHSVLKCTLAYLLGSIPTFWPPLSNFLGHRDGKHITATITVYFHPARTTGSMLEAVLISIAAVAYAEVISVLAMAVAIAVKVRLGFVEPAHVIILIVFIGGGLGLVGWVKQKLNQPLVNVATTLTSIAIISVVTKEESVQDGYFSEDKIVQVLKMLLIGIACTVAVNVLVWPVSARRKLRQSMVKASTALSDKLSIIAKAFINGTEEELKSAEYKQVTASYRSAHAVITNTLREAKFEHYFLGKEKIYPLDKAIFKSIEALSQAIGGLRSAIDSQVTLLKELPSAIQTAAASQAAGGPQSPKLTRAVSAVVEDPREPLAVIDEEDGDSQRGNSAESQDGDGPVVIFEAPSDIFVHFIDLLGPSMKSLSFTLSEILHEPPFGEDPRKDVIINSRLRQSLRDALTLYNDARGGALEELYRSIEMSRSHSEKIQADIEEVAAACGHFSFSLQAVAEEIEVYLDALEDLKYALGTNTRSWEWAKPWKWLKRSKTVDPLMAQEDPEEESLLPKEPVNRLKRSAVPRGIPNSMLQRRDTFNWDAAPHASKIMRTASQKVLQFFRLLAREDILFGIKVGIGAVLWGQFAFIDVTRPIYQHWRGEWGLLSYMIVVGMTTGASNTTSTSRFKGTVIGASCACIVWLIGGENPFVLAFCGWVVSFWAFYWFHVVGNAPLGRTSMLAYNVSLLYAYSISQKVDDDDDDEGGESPLIFDIAWHRFASVTLGIIWGMVVCRLLWPISARRKFKEGLSVLYLQLGLIWRRGPLGVLLKSHNTRDYMREGEQAALQRYASKLDALCNAAKSEFELRGPFPHQAYQRILHSTRHVLDGFYAMRLITQKRVTLSETERALLEFTAQERALLCQRICHVFQVLASSIMLEYPLTDAIPTVESNKDRLLNQIYQFRKDQREKNANSGKKAVVDERDYALLYAYTLVTAQVAHELKNVRTEIEMLFGVLHEEALLLE